MSCDRNECKVLHTQIVGTQGKSGGKIVPDLPDVDYPKGDKKAAAAAFVKAVNTWGEPETKEPKCKEKGCECSTEPPTDDEWKKIPETKRDFVLKYKLSDGTTITITTEVAFKTSLVTGICLEPPGKPIDLGQK